MQGVIDGIPIPDAEFGDVLRDAEPLVRRLQFAPCLLDGADICHCAKKGPRFAIFAQKRSDTDQSVEERSVFAAKHELESLLGASPLKC